MVSLALKAKTETHLAGNWTDLQYSSDSSLVNVYWSGFADAESGVANYRVAVGRGTYNVALKVMEVQADYFLPFTSVGLVSLWRKASFSFPDGTNVVVSVQAVNTAGLGTTVSANGFTIDL